MTSEKSIKIDIHHLLESINQDLDDFIKTRIQKGSFSNKDWSNLFDEPETEWCWEALSCNKKECPAYQGNDYRCWLIAGTLCGGLEQGVFVKKFGSCLNCTVYQQYQKQPIRALYENINILISHLSDEAYEFRQKARTDSLTGLFNRASFEEITGQEVNRSKRMDGTRLSLVVFDLDNLKSINDQGGHLVGDYYLVEFAGIILGMTRETDFVFRTGGDEFTVLIVGGKEEMVLRYIARVQEAIADWNANKDRPHPYELAASAGGACLNEFNYNIEKCLYEADERMYQNKQERKALQQNPT